MKGLMCRHGQLVFLHSPFIRKFAATLLMFSVFILQCGCCRSCVVLVCVCHCFAGLTSFALGKELFASWSLVWRVGDFQLMVLML